MDNPGQPLLTDTMVDHCSITMVKPCLTIVKTNHASPILQKCQIHGEAWFNHCIPCYSMVLQLWFSMVKHGLTMVKHGNTQIISQGHYKNGSIPSKAFCLWSSLWLLLALLEPTQGGSDKSLNTCVGHKNFFPTKFHKHPSSGSVVKADYVCSHVLVHPHPSFT